MGNSDDVVKLRSDQLEWRINDLQLRLDSAPSLILALKALEHLGWVRDQQIGLRAGEKIAAMTDLRHLRDERERLRASGIPTRFEEMTRPTLLGPWAPSASTALEQRPIDPRTPAQRQYAKEKADARKPPAAPNPPARKPDRPAGPVENDPTISIQLFDDLEESLRYEVNHYYLMTVPRSQRQQWPLVAYDIQARFMEDIEQQSSHLSRAQIVSAIVDVVSSRMNDVNSRRPRPLRDGGGEAGRLTIARSTDGAVAWRANISHGTPAARRIMWWRRTSGLVELARLATHDDVEMPER